MNILGSIRLSKNISNLHYLWLYQYTLKHKITLDITNEFPKHMRVCVVAYKEKDD